MSTRAARLAVRQRMAAPVAGPYLVRRRPRPAVVVAQMGKVGSQAVVASLQAAGISAAQVHFLDRASLRWAARVYARNWDPQRLPWHVWEGRWAARRLRAGERLDIITLAREPVGRNLSAFFQVADLQLGVDLSRPIDMADLRRVFLERFDEHERPLRWFDEELKRATGVDVYRQRLDPERGYGVMSTDRARVLVLRTDRLSETFAPAVAEFLGRPGLALVRANESSRKATGDLYERARRDMDLPAAYLEQMYNSKYARHFWSPEELAALRAGWTARAEAPA